MSRYVHRAFLIPYSCRRIRAGPYQVSTQVPNVRPVTGATLRDHSLIYSEVRLPLEIFSRAFTGEPVQFQGEHYSLEGLVCRRVDRLRVRLDGEDGISLMAESDNFQYLKTLLLNDNLITPEAAGYLAQSKAFPALETLSLFRNEMGDEGAKSLAESSNFLNLTHLYVGQNNITDVGAVALVRSKNFPKLSLLDMIQNKLGEETLKAIFKYNKDQRVQIVIR